MTRTNVTRLLECAGIVHTALAYEAHEDLSGGLAARALGLPPEMVFKTLALRGDRTGVFICCIPCLETIDLRKAAAASRNKKAEMLPLKELLPTTGYPRGGCSPIGMKRRFPLFFDETCALWETIAVNAGSRGVMVVVAPDALMGYTGARAADLIRDGRQG